MSKTDLNFAPFQRAIEEWAREAIAEAERIRDEAEHLDSDSELVASE